MRRSHRREGVSLTGTAASTAATVDDFPGINYAALVAIWNPAEGVGPWDWETLKKVYPRLNPLSLSIVLAALPRIAAIGDQPRVGDGLRMHPEMTSE
jgi:5'-methylthioadenosine phosphorylase